MSTEQPSSKMKLKKRSKTTQDDQNLLFPASEGNNAAEAKPDALPTVPKEEEQPANPPTASEVSELDPSEDLQSKLDACAWEHGPARLKIFFPGASQDGVDLAVKRYKERILQNLTAEYLHWGPPLMEDSGLVGQTYVWRTQCGQYKIARFVGTEPRFTAVTKIDARNASERTIGHDFKRLRDALEFVQKHHTEQSGKAVESNAEVRITEAEHLGLATNRGDAGIIKPDGDGKNEPKREETMKASVQDLQKLIVACGLSKSETVEEKWPAERLQRYMGSKLKFDELMQKAKTDPEGDLAVLLDQIAQAFATGTFVEVEGTVVEKKVKKEKKEKKTKSEKKAKAAKPSKNGEVKKREGMGILDAAIKVLTDAKKPLKPQEMLEKITAKGLWKTDAKTPEATLRGSIYHEIKRKGKDSRFAKAKEVRGAFVLK